MTPHRGGGWYSGGWIKDAYQYGSATQGDVASIISQARRLTQPPCHAQYQVLITDIYLARFAQSGYTNAMRGNWSCCISPNLTGVIDPNATGGAAYTGNWWTMRTYADLTGSLVSTSGQVGSTAISAAEDSARPRAVAVIGDANGYTGAASVTFNGFSAVPWLPNNGTVEAVGPRRSSIRAAARPEATSSSSSSRPRRAAAPTSSGR